MKQLITALTLVTIMSLVVTGPASGQEKKKAEKEPVKEEKAKDEKKEGPAGEKSNYTVFKDIILEDFETTVYTDKGLDFIKSTHQEAHVSIRDQEPAPTGSSKKYLGVKVNGKLGDIYIIRPAKEIIIDKFCRTISFWVYGKRFSGELSFLLQDGTGQTHRYILGKLDFLGWKKLTVTIDSRVKQEDEFLNQKRVLKITQFQYRPTNAGRLPQWQYFYIDDITAQARDKYSDRQSDEW